MKLKFQERFTRNFKKIKPTSWLDLLSLTSRLFSDPKAVYWPQPLTLLTLKQLHSPVEALPEVVVRACCLIAGPPEGVSVE